MAVTVTDNRTTLDAADSTTNFNTGSSNTTDFAEATGSISRAVNTSTGQIYYDGTMPNFTTTGNELIYVWSSNTATQNSFSAGASSSHGMWLSDGTNDLVILMAGNDRETFKHFETQVQFQCFLFDIDYVDEANTASRVYVAAGTVSGFNEASVTQVGSYYVTTSKALAGGFNTFIDIIRYGGREDGIQIAGGGVGTEGTFGEVCAEDRSKANNKAHGIIREYTTGSYGCQGTLRIGDANTASTYFRDSNFSVTWEDRLVDDDKFGLYFDANSTGTNEIELSNGQFVSARASVLMDLSSANINSLQLIGITFNSQRGAISFPTDTNGTTLDHDVTDCLFNNCGQVDPGSVVFERNTFSNWTSGATGALLLDADGTANWDALTFNCGVSAGHAIYITATGTYNLTNMTFNNQQGTAGSNLVSSSGSTDATVYNNSGGAVTLNMSNSNIPSVRNGAGASTTVNNTVTVAVKTVTLGGVNIASARVLLEAASGGALASDLQGTLARSGTTATFTSTGGAHGLSTGDTVAIRFDGTNAVDANFLGLYTVTVSSTTAFTYTVANTGATTGNAQATAVILSGTTDVNGDISTASFSYAADQPVRGTTRRSTTSPIYKDGTIVGTITAAGFSATVPMAIDQ